MNTGPPPARSRTWDVVLSSLVLVVAAVVVATGVFVGVISVAFLDDCSPPTCRADDAWIAVGAALAAAVVLGLAGLVMTIVRLTRRRAAWPFASATLLLVVLAVAAGVIGYAAAVHPR
jgi:hypothetical protein